jgi:uncharacterized protein (TIRG00374 family)
MGPVAKKRLLFGLKLAISVGIIYWIYHGIFARDGADQMVAHLRELKPGWVVASALSLCAAIFCSILRWDRLLQGQGIHASARHLLGSFMIGRFFGAVTPGGLGHGGYRVYDIARHTGKTSRSLASVAIEMVLGNMAVGIVAVVSSSFGYRYIGAAGVGLLCAVFGGLIAVTLSVLWKPRLVRALAQRLPRQVAARLHGMVDAVCAYEGRGGLLAQTAVLAMGTHAFNALIYVCAAQALGVELPAGELFFVSVLQNVGAHLPLSINGVGLREGAALGLYTVVGVPAAQAVLIPLVGFTVEMIISSLGGLWLVARRSDYNPVIRVDHPEREAAYAAEIEHVAESEWPLVGRGAAIGLGAGLCSGLVIGLAEALAIVRASRGHAEPDVWFFGALSYAIFCGAGGLVAGAVLAFSGRLMQRRRTPEHVAFAQLTALFTGVFALVIGAFRVQRDVFHEELAWASVKGLGVLCVVALFALVLAMVLFFVLRALTARAPLKHVLSPAGSVSFSGVAVALALALPVVLNGERAQATRSDVAPAASKASGGNVLFVVVDTLRADHLPAYGYTAGKTPHLDAFARDAVRFEQAFANASWTRPSFASLLTGRYASSHGVMAKDAALPDGAQTLAESFAAAGYRTGGIVTNYNVAPFYNFQQGFDDYTYLRPNYLFGASDTAAKLSLIQIAKRVDDTLRGKLNAVKPGSAYHDAPTVNRELFAWLAQAKQGGAPWLSFVAYMDPHDPYFVHPYNGFGYSRSAHVKPRPDEADKLRKLYDGEITFWDEHFGELVAKLKSEGLYDDLTIVITADHGEEFMDHGGFWHGTTLYDEQLHVPLYVKLPRGERAGTTVQHWVESVDVMPTLLGLAKLPIPEAVQGVDLFRGKEQAFAEESHEGNVLKALRMQKDGAQLKLILANPGNPRGLKEKELYRVDRDVREADNLAAKDAPALAHGEATLQAAEKQAKVGALKARAVDVSMDAAAQERLKALGYADE